MKKGIIIAIMVILLAVLSSCGEESERNKVGSSIDWGDGYYWDSSTESVQKTLW